MAPDSVDCTELQNANIKLIKKLQNLILRSYTFSES